jgi:hypothetical protein
MIKPDEPGVLKFLKFQVAFSESEKRGQRGGRARVSTVAWGIVRPESLKRGLPGSRDPLQRQD